MRRMISLQGTVPDRLCLDGPDECGLPLGVSEVVPAGRDGEFALESFVFAGPLRVAPKEIPEQ